MANDSDMTLYDLRESFSHLQENADHFFLLVVSCLIFLMQLGFAFLEAGSVRAKNTTNILLKNVLDICIGAVAYWSVGYAFAFGSESNPFIGYRNFFFEGLSSSDYSYFFFHYVFAATAATIVSGALAERCEFVAYFIYSSIITAFVYPVVTHWAWSSDGWLGNSGIEISNGTFLAYQDFAGSGVVHCVGGTAALIGAAILGPRIGRFADDGTPIVIPGHTVPMVSLGGFLLFFGFFAFNGGSQASISQEGDGEVVALAFVNTIISGAFAALAALFFRKVAFSGNYWSLLTTINGGLVGMVAICAGCNAVYPWGAAIIGAVSGVAYVLWNTAVVKMKLDDPLDAVAVHLGGGIWGVIAIPIFDSEDGIIFDITNREPWLHFGWNILGVCVIIIWTAVLSLIMFGTLSKLGMLRVIPEIEKKGLDIPKHGEPAYPQSSYGSGWEDDLMINAITSPPRYSADGRARGGLRSMGSISELEELGDMQRHRRSHDNKAFEADNDDNPKAVDAMTIENKAFDHGDGRHTSVDMGTDQLNGVNYSNKSSEDTPL